MPELLLELLTEEIPARMQTRAAEDLSRLATERFAASGFAGFIAQSFVTPRRLTLVIDNLPATQADTVEERRGPRLGSPQSALDGFLKSVGVSLQDCEQRDTGKGVFYFATIRRAGRTTEAILPELIHAILLDLPWPKSMRFPAAPFRWVRPLTSVLCLFDGKVVALNLGQVPVGSETSGHRFLAPAKFSVRDFADYRKNLRDAHVVLDAKDRRQAITLALYERAAEANLTIKDDPGLLEEVMGLVEWPVVLMGSIDTEFMDLPPEVLTTSMRTHQKYFSSLDHDGKLAPRFLLVANNIADDGGKAIVAGNERVLRARLSDARFFWDQDRKVRLKDRVPRLDERIFNAKLGSVLRKVARNIIFAEVLSPHVPGADPLKVRRAAELAKADLSTGMVGEFPELQGIIGRYYALNDGESPEVAEAIAEHYSPLGPNDRCPSAPVSVVVALADKIDTLIGFFGINEKPTGSKDPFALRRAALGVIRLILENTLRIGLLDFFANATDKVSRFAESEFLGLSLGESVREAATSTNKDRERIVGRDLLDFFADRLKVHLRDQGLRHDLISAVFALGEDDLVRLVRRVQALEAFLKTEDGANLLTAYRRAANIVGIEEKKDGVTYAATPNIEEFVTTEEVTLAARLDEAEKLMSSALAAEDFASAMAALARLRGPIDEFFAKITVNDSDPNLRANRLKLLARIRDIFDRMADFSKIEG
jgi:glycyl-tRNA synthetase beta chain